MTDNPIPLQPGVIYHIYNRGNNRENLFVLDRDYRRFTALMVRHLCPVADLYVYCLLRNHFHLLVRVKDETPLPPSQAFSNLFNAYAKWFNRTHQRTGALFERPFHRIPVTRDAHLLRLVAYIHQNPQRHGLIADFRDWPYSSYATLLLPSPTPLQREQVQAWFGGAARLEEAHEEAADEVELRPLLPADLT